MQGQQLPYLAAVVSFPYELYANQYGICIENGTYECIAYIESSKAVLFRIAGPTFFSADAIAAASTGLTFCSVLHWRTGRTVPLFSFPAGRLVSSGK